MALPGLIYTYDDGDMQKRIAKAIKRCEDLTPALEIVGEVGVTSIQKNFEEYGRPDPWPELAATTMAKRQKTGTWPGQILVVSGELKRISTEVTGKGVVWSPGAGASKYAAIQHFGGMAGKGKKTKIPGRQYLMLQEEDGIEIKAVFADHVMGE